MLRELYEKKEERRGGLHKQVLSRIARKALAVHNNVLRAIGARSACHISVAGVLSAREERAV